MIELRTLGALELRRSNGPELLSVLAQPKRSALLCYLVLARPRGWQRRDALLPLFWPESDEERARNSLRQSVHFLRRSLGEDVIRSRGDDELSIGADSLWCDALAFEAALDAGQAEDALALYRGDLLPGFFPDCAPELEQWLELERERLRARAVAGAWALAEASEQAGEVVAAAGWGRAALALAPSDDGVLRKLMGLLARSGDPVGALAAYESDARWLRAQYEVEPSPEARALAEQIRGRTLPAATVAPAPALGSCPARTDELPGIAAPIAVLPALRAGVPQERQPRRGVRRVPVLAAVLVLLGAAAFWGVRLGAGPVLDAHRIAVLPFENRTGERSLDVLGPMAADWITQGLANAGGIRVVDAGRAAAAGAAAPDADARATLAATAAGTSARLVVLGAYYRQADSIQFQARLMDARSGDVLAAVGPVPSVISSSVAGVDRLSQLLMTAIVPLVDVRTAPELPPPHLPSFDAYRAYLEGVTLNGRNDYAGAVERFGTALAADSSFDRALVAQVSASMFATRGTAAPMLALFDSLAPTLRRRRDRMAFPERYRADYVLAIRDEDYRAAYRAARMELEGSPGSEQAMLDVATAASLTNRTDESAEMFTRLLPAQTIKVAATGRSYGRLGQLYHRLGRYREELEIVQGHEKRPAAEADAADVYINPLAALGRVDELRRVVDLCARNRGYTGRYERRALAADPYIIATEELLAHGYQRDALAMLAPALAWFESVGGAQNPDTLARVTYAGALIIAGRWTDAERALPTLRPQDEYYSEARYYAALIAAQRGDRAFAQAVEQELPGMPAPTFHNWLWDHPQVRLRQAAIALALGDRARALAYIREQYARGQNHGERAHLNPGLAPLRHDPEFIAISRPEG